MQETDYCFELGFFFPPKAGLNITIGKVVIDENIQKDFIPFYKKWSLKEKFHIGY